MIFRMLQVATFIAAAFLVFCFLLVVIAIGIVDPSSSPRAELDKLAAISGRVIRWWSKPRF